MHLRTLPLIPVLTAIALGLTANAASAATLFTTPAHTSRVSVGTTASIATTAGLRFTGAIPDTCPSSTVGLRLVQNNDAGVILSATAASFSGCSPFPPLIPTFTGTSAPWTYTINGNSNIGGTRTQWASALHNFSFDFAGSNYRGNFNSITAFQPTATSSPVCLELASAGTFTGPGGGGSLDATYCFEGGAAAWSLTN
jgi:hypothetical protein